jgi:hypothetical protein
MNLQTTISIYAGGPGSGCNPEKGKCGRPIIREKHPTNDEVLQQVGFSNVGMGNWVHPDGYKARAVGMGGYIRINAPKEVHKKYEELLTKATKARYAQEDKEERQANKNLRNISLVKGPFKAPSYYKEDPLFYRKYQKWANAMNSAKEAYHGTIKGNVDSILKKGLLPGIDEGSTDVYLSINKDGAKAYGDGTVVVTKAPSQLRQVQKNHFDDSADAFDAYKDYLRSGAIKPKDILRIELYDKGKLVKTVKP